MTHSVVFGSHYFVDVLFLSNLNCMLAVLCILFLSLDAHLTDCMLTVLCVLFLSPDLDYAMSFAFDEGESID